MPSLRSLIGVKGRRLAVHLDRLRQSLDTLGQRLREAVSHSVGEAAAGAVREAVHAVLSDLTARRLLSDSPARSPGPSRPWWQEPGDSDDDPWLNDRDRQRWINDRDDDFPSEDDDLHDSEDKSQGDSHRISRWSGALAAGCQAAAWWLRRRAGSFPFLTALGLGLTAGLVTYVGVPMAVVGVTFAGSALSLMTLAHAIHAGAQALTVCGIT